MIPLHSDTVGRAEIELVGTGTRVDLRATRAPARSPRATWHSLAMATVQRLSGHAGQWPPFIISLCRALLGSLAALTRMERHCDELESAVRLANGRVEFSDRGIAEQQRTIDELRAQMGQAQAQIRELKAERFEEPTRTRESKADIEAELLEFGDRPTRAR